MHSEDIGADSDLVLHVEPLKPTGLIDFPKLEPGHVWLMAVMAGSARGLLTPDVFADADQVVAEYKKKFGF